MKFTHHGLQIELPDDWWTEAGMAGFVPLFKAYRVNHSLFQNVREVPLEYVGPVSLSRQWKSSRAKLDTRIDISWFMVRIASIVRWLRDSSAYRRLRVLIEGKAQGLFAGKFRTCSSPNRCALPYEGFVSYATSWCDGGVEGYQSPPFTC